MARTLTIAAAQMGSIHRTSPRSEVLARMLTLLDTAASQGVQLLVFPEIAFTTFFPRYLIDSETLDSWYERGEIASSTNTKPLFDKARERGVDIVVGYAELTDEGKRFNTCVYYSAHTGSVLSKYRKIHLPGTSEPFAGTDAIQQLEKLYFLPGDLGFEAFRAPGLLQDAGEAAPIVGMMICNDRRWAESWRVLGLQGVEIVCCGYNTPGFAPDLYGSDPNQDPTEARTTNLFHHKLVMQAHSYTNATYSICAARCGLDDGKFDLIAGSCIVDPEGRVLAEAKTEGDEVVAASVDLSVCRQGKEKTFAFAKHRRVEAYGRITAQTGAVEPPLA